MAFEADRVVVELLAKVDQYDGTVKQSAATFTKSMDDIERSATKAEQGFTKSSAARSSAVRREAQEISKASGIIGSGFADVSKILSSPSSPFIQPVKQAPAVRQAMSLVQVGATALGGVLGGALVQAGMAAADMLVDLIQKHIGLENEIDDLVEKLKENARQTAAAEAAQAIYANTIEGVTEATIANEKAVKKLNEGNDTAAHKALVASLATIEHTKVLQADTKALLDNAEAQLANNQSILTGVSSPQAREFASQNINTAQQRVTELRKTLTEIDSLILRNQNSVNAAIAARTSEQAERAAEPLNKIADKYEKLISQAKQTATEQANIASAAGNTAKAESIVGSELKKQLDIINAQKKAEEDRYKASQRRASSTRQENQQSGRQINEAQARAIVASIGGTVTSGFRTVQHNEDVGGVKGSFHTKGQAVDIAKTAGLTLDKIVKAFETQGVRLIEKLDEGDHFHIAFARRSVAAGRRGPDPQRLADTEERREQAFENEKANLDAQLIDARQALIGSAEEINKLELQSIEVTRQKYADNVESLVTTRRLTEDEGKELLKLNDERAKLRSELVLRREAQRNFRIKEAELERKSQIEAGSVQAQEELLQSQEGIATTQRQRLEIGRRLVDLQFQEERRMLEAAIAREARLRAEYARTKSQETLAELEQAEVDAAIARQRLGTIDERQGAAQTGNARANQNPLQSYFGDIQAQANDLDSAFAAIAAGGLQTFEDKLTDAIVNFRSLGDVGRAVLSGITADLVRLAIRLILNATIGKLVQSAATAAAAAGGAAVATAWAPAAAAVSLATFGANAGPAAAAITSTNALAMGFAAAGGGGGFADGGRIRGRGTSTSDSNTINASNDEFMIRASSARSIGYPTLEQINRTGTLPYANGGRIGRGIRPANATARAPGGGFGPSDIAALRGVIGEAVAAGISAMPDVAIYNGLDPVAMLQKALGSPAGQKALFATLGSNKTLTRTALQ